MHGQWRLLVLYCFFGSHQGQNPSWFQNISTNLFKSPGDFLLGGIFPINVLTSNLSERVEPDDIHCGVINEYGLALSFVMKYSVDEINARSDLLPGIRLGFEIFDSCMQSAVIMKPTLFFLSEGSSEVMEVRCNYTDYVTRVVAVIGPYSSEMVSMTGKLMGFFLMPQISYGATSERFSDKSLYPSFMRTVPSDRWQVEAMVQLLKEFHWNWVAVVGSEDEYGRKGQQQFSSVAGERSICVAYEGVIPIYSDPVPVVTEILQNIVMTKVGVVVVFALAEPAKVFFTEVIRRNMTGIWVASTAWALHNSMTALPNIHTVGTILAFADMTQRLGHFSSYMRELFTKIEEERLQSQSTEQVAESSPLDNPCPDCWQLSPDNMSLVEVPMVQRTAFSVYAAIYSIAQALHDMLGCNTTSCPAKTKHTKIYPWQLLKELWKVKLNINGTYFKYDEEGNPSIGYDVLVWVFDNNTVRFKDIGIFNQNLTINKSLIKWYTGSAEVPQSTCSENCAAGQVRRVKGFHSCCFDCIDCREGTFQNNTDDVQCTPCPRGQWSVHLSTNCTHPTFEYLSWSSYKSLGLVLVGAVLLMCQATVGILFFRHRGTPLVNASGGSLSGLSLLSLMGGCASLVLFLGRPNDLVCRLQLPLNAIFPTVALSTILAISLQIVCVTEFPERVPAHLENLRGAGSWMVVLTCCGVQAGLSGWYVHEGPSLSQYLSNLEVNFVRRFLCCPVQPILNFGLMLGFNGVLSLISFMCTFMAPKPARQYNLARDITISTLAYCLVWVVFIPVYTGLDDEMKAISHMTVSLLSNMALMAAYFFPKCLLLIKHPEFNTDDHFCTFLDGAPPVPQESQNKQ
ncbi:LOW QUALITY PROTEIN: taste receptor type 1 member 3 [Chanos chanos]|uniref:Taste receptor type 1 member 3 n=1 Tax=Chanos chanos TaxID=29144 RepID=A0A6J2VQX7_CHACN|nr:LOW QUALITY PROTEIN: taste receptor type 1 member 3 [Chanos chanos]